MRKVTFWVLLCVLLTVFGCAPAEWVDFESDEGEFAVLMPANPQTQRKTVPTPIGPMKVVMYTHDAGAEAYIVGFSDYPKAVLEKLTPEKMLSDGVKGGIAKIRGTKKSEKNINLDGYPGKEYTFTIPSSRIPGGGKGKARMYMVENRLYQILALGKKSAPEADFNKFLDSFELYGEE